MGVTETGTSQKKGGAAVPSLKSAYADESSENNPVPRAFSLAWGCSENYVNLALAGYKMFCAK